MLEVTEIFKSLQGEGPFMGRPAVFIRLSGCVAPLCPWCDTPEGHAPGLRMAVEAVIDRISGGFVVITGGEPFLQWQTGLRRLEQGLLEKGCRIQYETSGKIEIPEACGGFVVCSPKRLDGAWHFVTRNLERVDAFKFVVQDDFDAVRAFIQAHAIDARKVWIMAQGATRAEQLERSRSIWDFCVANGYHYAPRLHILVFDRQKGV